MKRFNQSGSHVVAVALLILVLGVAAFAGYKVLNANKKDATTTTASTQVKTTVPSTIQNTAELNQASAALDNSSAQVNSNLDDSALNNDLNDML